MTPTVLKLQILQIGATQYQITHHLVLQTNLIEKQGPNRPESHGGQFRRQSKITPREAQFLNIPISQNREREIVSVITGFVVVKVSVDEEVEVELPGAEVGDGGSHPGVDVGVVVTVEDEGEAESVDGRIGAGNQNAIDELGVELAGVQRQLARREEFEVEIEEATDQDRSLNDLPEDLLLRILTFLPTLGSVQTSLISQKWRPLWSLVPSLDFRFELFPPREPPSDTCQFYAEFVDRVLISRPNSPVHTFRLTFIFHDHYHSHVDSWVRSAVTYLRARDLHLDFFIHRDFHNDETHNYHYDFPFSFLGNGCVEKLSLTRCYLTLPAKLSTTRFWTIRSLLLDMVCLEDQMMNDLILGCPNLEDLELQNCWGHHHLKICSKSLKRLAFGFFYDSEIRETVSIDCPNLCSISFDCCSFYRFALKNAASLVYFRVQIVNIMERYCDLWSRTVKLIEEAPNLKHLDALNWWFKFLTSTDSFPESFMLHNLKLLELQSGFTKHDLVGMAALLKHCPNLETMILEYPFKFREDESLPEELSDKSVEFSIPSLKQVTIKPYTGTEDEGNFVKILTEQGVVLEKIVLVPGQVGENGIVLMQVPPIVLYKKDSQSWKYSLLRNARCSLSFKLGIHRLSQFPCYFLD